MLLLNGATILDSVTFGPQAPDVSIGRIVNGTGGWQANTPTPGAVNLAKTLGSVANLRINEWMASPAYGDDWFELFNNDANPVALGGLHLSDDPAAPTTTRIPALSFIAGKGFTKFLADGSNNGGHHANFKLGGGGDNLVLTNASGAGTLDVVTFGAQITDVSQGRFPDGTVAVASFVQSASPGRANWQQAPIVINEAIANSTAPVVDVIEIFNPMASPVDIGGWWLSDDRNTPRKYQIPAGTSVPPGGYVVFDEGQFNAGANAFQLASAGDDIALSAVDGAGALTGFGAQVTFGATAENTSLGRVNVAGGSEFWPQIAPTPGSANSEPKTTPLIINEVMYHPVENAGGVDNSVNEFIELQNPGATAIDVTRWRISGDSEFQFPVGAYIAADSYVLLVSFNPGDAAALAAFRTKYNLTPATPIVGPYTPKLSNNAQKIELARPELISGVTEYMLVDRVIYRDLPPWPAAADGTGQSLQRQSRTVIGNDPANWSAAAPTPGAVNVGVITELTIVSGPALTGAVVGASSSQTLVAAGGAAPYSWEVSAGALPDGMALSAAGVLSGLPTTAGAFTFTARITDGANATVAKALTLTVASTALEITTVSPLPGGTYGVAYSQTLAATGGTAPYAWTRSAGLSGGLALSSAGVLSGTPLTPGVFVFTARVADAGGLVAVRDFSLTVPAPPLTITSPSLMPGGSVTLPYSQALLAVGGVGTLSWNLTAGALPGGLSMSASGDITGTPTVTGSFNFTATATDTLNTIAVKTFTLVITPAPLVITTATPLASGIVGTAYAAALAATGGTVPHVWSISAGSLPPGISLSSAGLFSGTPTAAGTFNFTARVTDNAGVISTKVLALTTAQSGPLHHFTWNHAPSSANANASFAVRLTARDAQERLVADFSGSVNLSAASGLTLPSPVVITEITDGQEDQIELQNVSNAAAGVAGWYVKINDSIASINTVNANQVVLAGSLAAGGLVWISEVNTPPRTFWPGLSGTSIAWSASGVSKGWIMLFDASHTLRDFFIWGWTSADLAALNVTINGTNVTAASAGLWTGAPQTVVGGGIGTFWARTGAGDTNVAGNFTKASAGATFNSTNSGLTLPWTSATPVALTPASVALVNGEFIGSLTIAQTANNVTITAADTAGHTGTTAAFNVAAALADTDEDEMPDAWEIAHGLNPAFDEAALDLDADGTSNLAEFLAGTDPQNPASIFVSTPIALPASGQFTIGWNGVAGKIYQFSTSSDLETWNPVAGSTVLATATGPRTMTLDVSGAPRLFVRVEIMP